MPEVVIEPPPIEVVPVPVTDKLVRADVPQTAPLNVVVPVPAPTVNPNPPLTVLLNVILLSVVVRVDAAPRFTAPV